MCIYIRIGYCAFKIKVWYFKNETSPSSTITYFLEIKTVLASLAVNLQRSSKRVLKPTCNSLVKGIVMCMAVDVHTHICL